MVTILSAKKLRIARELNIGTGNLKFETGRTRNEISDYIKIIDELGPKLNTFIKSTR